jgi:hypothetical protein
MGTTLIPVARSVSGEHYGLSQGMVTNQTERSVEFRHGKKQRIGGLEARKEKSGHDQGQSVPGACDKLGRSKGISCMVERG